MGCLSHRCADFRIRHDALNVSLCFRVGSRLKRPLMIALCLLAAFVGVLGGVDVGPYLHSVLSSLRTLTR
jgi:hypothetical protein